MFCTVVGRSTLDAGLAKLAGRDGLPFRMPEPDELPSVPDEEIRVRVDVSAQRAARVAAMRAHATQVAVWSDGEITAFAVSNLVAQPLLDVEEFVPAGGAIAHTDDLFGEIMDA
jgi:N-acetyl-1-D-myo-inositol-2-amino-2-deoxy-alpha-D-glucopyranoside deacetylase